MVTLLIPPTRENKPYRLRCRFKTDPSPGAGWLQQQAVRVAERFVADMRKQGWVHDPRYQFRLRGPFTPVDPTTIHPRRMPTAREMAPLVARGARFLDESPSGVSLVLPLGEVGYWEYEIAAVFVRPQIMTEVPDLHEER